MRKKLIILCVLLTIFNYSFAQKQVQNISFKPINTAEADWIRTLKSLQKIGDLYVMTYYDNYNHRLNQVNQKIIKQGFDSVRKLKGSNIKCSMFAAFAGSPFYGRNFDNPPCGVLVAIYRPADGYASLGFSRLNDFGFAKGDDPTKLAVEKRRLLLNAPFFTPDGMNECGLTVALAAVKTANIHVDKDKKSIFITQLVREILDHAKNIKEAVAIINKFNVYDSGVNRVSHHLLISDPANGSVIVEYANDGWQAMPNRNKWQVIANSPLYHIPEDARRQTCWRYKILSETLEKSKGIINWQQGMDMLKSVSLKGTQWSTICDLKSKQIYISTYRDYNHIQKIGFE